MKENLPIPLWQILVFSVFMERKLYIKQYCVAHNEEEGRGEEKQFET